MYRNEEFPLNRPDYVCNITTYVNIYIRCYSCTCVQSIVHIVLILRVNDIALNNPCVVGNFRNINMYESPRFDKIMLKMRTDNHSLN